VNTRRGPAGIIPALSTPTDRKGELDEGSLRSLVRHNIDWGVQGLAVSIIAGEFYKFSDEERLRSIEVVIDEANGKAPVWAGVNHIGTEPAVKLAAKAKDAGAFGLVSLPPFVGTKGDGASKEHFDELMERVDLPMMIQDSEDFTGVHMRTNLYVQLKQEHSNLASIKIEGGDTLKKMEDVLRISELEGVTVLGGMGAKLLLQELGVGTHGSVPASCLTDLVVGIYEDYTQGRTAAAKEMFARYRPWLDFLALHSASSAEVQKETSRLRGLIESSQTRSPHTPLGDDAKGALAAIVRDLFPKTPRT
jgi:4-hydroxy-tetrahydrodipicolinate synthase